MFLMISLLIALAVAIFGFSAARRFVRDKLRFVDAAQRTSAPFIAGGGALLIGAVLALLIPGVGTGTALAFALAIGTGVAAGARDVRTGRHLISDGTR
jgi:hypothetical protein